MQRRCTRKRKIHPVDKMASRRNSPKLLLADDDDSSLRAFAIFFELEGFDVRIAHDGREAVELYERWHPDLALLDIDMPYVNGYEVARRMRADMHAPPPLLIAVTGRGDSPSERDASLTAGFDYHASKPVRLSRLLDLVNRHLFKLSH